MDIRDSKSAIDYLIKKTKETRDVSWLVQRLGEHERTISPELRDYIAVLLEQKYESKKLIEYRPSSSQLALQLNSFKAILRGDTGIPWIDVLEALKNVGIQEEVFDSKGEITKTAKAMTRRYSGLTEDQLDEAINPRRHRKKFR